MAPAAAVPPAGPDERIAWVTTLLSEFLWMSDNDAVGFEGSVEPTAARITPRRAFPRAEGLTRAGRVGSRSSGGPAAGGSCR
ncbi:hypothetical protein GCM10009733_065460 [Nonomuraea maheshkhaliensis]|uniref:Uncharacterized protein n=1 Tax=Nonomuraea maheshkhaliensis TaxID=419590 RepID=A0ABP4RS07_9ACTN